eukprot:766672-Hanusia_phi.AAC.2
MRAEASTSKKSPQDDQLRKDQKPPSFRFSHLSQQVDLLPAYVKVFDGRLLDLPRLAKLQKLWALMQQRRRRRRRSRVNCSSCSRHGALVTDCFTEAEATADGNIRNQTVFNRVSMFETGRRG